MKKLPLIIYVFSLAFIFASCSSSKEIDKPGETSIIIKTKTDESVILKNKSTTRAEDPSQYWLSVDKPDGNLIDEELLGSTQREITNIQTGDYTVVVSNFKKAASALPDYNKQIFKGTLTKNVTAGASTLFDITCTQSNVGIKFVFDESATGYFTSLMGTITDSNDADKKLTLGPDDEGVNTAYFEAPGKLKLSFTNEGTPIQISGNDYAEIDVLPKQLWTITFKTSSKAPGSIEMEVNVDETVDPQDPEFGLGDVDGAGTLESPYSVSDAINAMPVNYVWVQGYITGSLPATPAGEPGNVLLGRAADSPANECIAIELPEGGEIHAYLNLADSPGNQGRHVAVQGNVSGKASFAPDAFAVMTDVTIANLNYAESYAPFNYKFQNATLKNSASFPVGTAIKHEQLEYDPTYVKILKQEFSSVTSEYNMKMTTLWENESNRYAPNFEGADKIVAFAMANGMRVHGHTLIWSQDNVIPDWVKALDLNEEGWTDLMKEYIAIVVTHFAHNVSSWDVVNEAYNNNDGNLRGTGPDDVNTFWYDKVGSDFIEIAFRTAREVLDELEDTDCKLFYNDYLWPEEQKRTNMVGHLSDMIDAGVPIEGLGLQMHYDVRPDYPKIKAAFTDAAALGVLVHASEIDMLINNPSFIGEAKNSEWIAGNYVTMYEMYYGIIGDYNFNLDYAHGKSYNMIVSAYMDHVPEAQRYGVTTWGFTDKDAMVYGNNYGYPDHALMFTRFYSPKRAYAGVLEGLRGVDWQAMEEAGGQWGWAWRWNNGFEAKAPWD